MEEFNSEYEREVLQVQEIRLEIEFEQELLLDLYLQPGFDVERDFEQEENEMDDEMDATDRTNTSHVLSIEDIRDDEIQTSIEYNLILMILVCVFLIERIIIGNVMSGVYYYIPELKFKMLATSVICLLCLAKAMFVFWMEEDEYHENDGTIYQVEEDEDDLDFLYGGFFVLRADHHVENLSEDVPRPAERGDGPNE